MGRMFFAFPRRDFWLVVEKPIFYFFYPECLGFGSHLTCANIFQMGLLNHQLQKSWTFLRISLPKRGDFQELHSGKLT